ncbi:pseudouridine synthase [Microlunatus sp. Gsoil 973]|uniref:pseudouridine synthase n=1 Tax=Microlunatus sp. Gsoil 973 TaxID=2672569 RepID=UPI00351B497E
MRPATGGFPPDRIYDHVRSYPAQTGFRRLAEGAACTVLELRPHTGRRHQLRVQLAWIGHPIEGDPLFCKSSAGSTGVSTDGRTCLHARRLTFSHPTTGERLTLITEPDDGFWEPYDGSMPVVVD